MRDFLGWPGRAGTGLVLRRHSRTVAWEELTGFGQALLGSLWGSTPVPKYPPGTPEHEEGQEAQNGRHARLVE